MSVALPVCDVLCVCNSFEKEWLKESRFIVVVDPIEKIEQEKVRYCFSDDIKSMKKIAWEFVFLEFGFMGEGLEELKHYIDGVHLVASDFENRGLNHLENFCKNQKKFPRAREGRKLFGAFKGIPAVICGAGPSLEKEIPKLKQLENKALIFAGGSAVSALAKLGIKPHFAGFIDPHPPEKRLFQHKYQDIPTFFQSRTHHEVIDSMRGELLWMPGAENDLFEDSYFDGGWNVATFLVAIATHLGCNPIHFAGIDLSQTKEKTYAGDLERSEGGELIALEDGTYTRKDWLYAKQWLESWKQNHPEIDWEKEIEAEQQNLNELVLQKIQEIPQGVSCAFEQKELKRSFQRVGERATQMLQFLEKAYPNPIENNADIFLLELEIEKEMSFSQFLTPVWNIWKPVFSREIAKEVPTEYGIGLNKWLFMKGICDDAAKI